MRGQLRISSQRSPYLRGGLSWSNREPVEPHIGELDGARLLELLRDPLLTLTIADEAGTYRPLPTVGADVTAEQAQVLIDAFADGVAWWEEAPEAPASDALQLELAEVRERNVRQAETLQRTADELNSAREELVVRSRQLDQADADAVAAAEREKGHLAEIERLKVAVAARPRSHKSTPAAASQA